MNRPIKNRRHLLSYGFLAVLLLVSSGLCMSCIKGKKEKEKMEKQYKWEAGGSSPLGYPVRVTMGGFSNRSLSITVIAGPWGDISYLGGSGAVPLPRQIVAEWVSLAEGEHGKAYQIKADLDFQKMEQLFDEAYELEFANGRPNKKMNFDTVVAGFAPDGVVVVWVKGIGRKIEIGRYQGYEVTPEDFDLYPETLKFLTPYWNDLYRSNINYIPKSIQDMNKGKEPPYGLWDSLRQRFNYTVKVECADGGVFLGGDMRFVNGEFKYTKPTQTNDPLYLKEEAAPRNIVVVWETLQGERLGTEVYLEEVYSLALFKQFEAGDKSTEIELTIRINEINDYYAVFIKNNKGREQIVKLNPTEEVKVYLAP